MAEGSAAAECNGLDIPVLGCLDTGYWGLDAIIALAPTLFGLWMYLLGGKQWRKRIREVIYDASWSTAYAGLLENVLVRLRWFFGRPWSRRALDMCFRLAVIYAHAYIVFAGVMGQIPSPTEIWFLAGAILVFGPTSFLIARQVRRRHLLARQGSEHHRRRLWLHLREQLTYFALLFVIVFAVGAGAVAVARALVEAGAVAVAVAGPAISGALTGALAGAVAGAVAGAGAVAVAGAIAGYGAGAGAVAVTTLAGTALAGVVAGARAVAFAGGLSAILFSVSCPNALFDWPSWAVSRWLMQRLRADATRSGFLRRAGAILTHLAFDGAIAIACLFGLAIVLINFAHAIDVEGFLVDTLNAAKETPFSAEGSAMTVMLLSTLVPTALHLFFALFALAAIRPPYRDLIAGWLEEHHGGGEWGNRAIVSAYLTLWMVFALAVLWGAAMALLRGLDWLWLRLGWGLETDPYPFWASIFRAAEAFVIF